MRVRPPLALLLLLATAAELALNRLAVPALRPAGDAAPPLWHRLLDHVGLFALYFASLLAVGVLAWELWRLARGAAPYPLWVRAIVVAAGIPLTTLGLLLIAISPGADLSFMLDTSFTLMVLVIALAQLTSRGELAVKVGLLLLATPLLVHYYEPFALRFLGGEEAAWEGLPERVRRYGQWTMVVAALVSPYAFAPRPLFRTLGKLAPLTVGASVGVLSGVILRQHYEVGMLVASRGLGIDLGPGAPLEQVALYLLALATIGWTLTACFLAESPARRGIGIGVALVAIGGYAFSWPLQYLVGVVGLLVVGAGATAVAAQEHDAEAVAARGPPVSDDVWNGYVAALAEALRSSGSSVSVLTARGEEECNVTHVVTERRGVPLRARLERVGEAIVAIDILCGEEVGDSAPDFTLQTRPERRIHHPRHARHPAPPRTDAPLARTQDANFDARFRCRDGGQGRLSEQLFDDGLRARATAVLDGWLALWPGRALRYRVHPGVGAPLDHPIPITELAFRGAAVPPSVERLVTLIDLLVDLASRAGLRT